MSIDRNNHINLFRLLFALQVVYMHSTVWLNLPIWGMLYNILSLFPGVPLFFITSGFLITDSYLNSNGLKHYFIKRGLRIYPALFICIVILEASMFFGKNMNNISISIFEYFIYLTIYTLTASSGIATTMIGVDGLDIYNFNGFFSAYPSGVLWTLTVELSFYIILPLMFYFKQVVVRNIILSSVAVLSIFISTQATQELYLSSSMYKLLNISFLPYIWMFIIGIFIRIYFNDLKNIIFNKGLYWLTVYLFISYFAYFIFKVDIGIQFKYNLTLFTLFQVLILALTMLSMAFSFTNLKINLKSDLSYATYLYHMLVVHIMLNSGITTNGYTYFIIMGITLCIAYLSWNYIEKPMLKFKPMVIRNVK